MANSRIPVSLNPPAGPVQIPARTPGPLGLNDQADPNVTTRLGDSPGSTGTNDHADPNLPKSSPGAIAVRLPDGTPVAPGLDGKAPDPDNGAFVFPAYATIKESVGNGFCVPLVQQNTKVGSTSTWKAGDKLSDKPDLKPGTAVATFNEKGVYESKARGNHAAFFVSYDTRDGSDGMVIYDQYREWPDAKTKAIDALKASKLKIETSMTDPKLDAEKLKRELIDINGKLVAAENELAKEYPEVDDKGRRFKRKQPGERFVRFDHKGNPSNDASAYSVIIH